jgi:hypothetical protein
MGRKKGFFSVRLSGILLIKDTQGSEKLNFKYYCATVYSFCVRLDKAFAVTGIDFAGPFTIRGLPGQSESKAYICLFTCTTSGAIISSS